MLWRDNITSGLCYTPKTCMKTKEGQSPRENARARRTFPQQFLYSGNFTRNAVLKHSWVYVVALACLIKMHMTHIWLGGKPRELAYNPMITHASASSGNPSRSFQTWSYIHSHIYSISVCKMDFENDAFAFVIPLNRAITVKIHKEMF